MICPKCGKWIDSYDCSNCQLDFEFAVLTYLGDDSDKQIAIFTGSVKEREIDVNHGDHHRSSTQTIAKPDTKNKHPNQTDQNQEAANTVTAMINSIGTVFYNEQSRKRIEDAKTAYSHLTDEEKKLVLVHSKLTEAEAKYTLLKKEHEDKVRRNRAIVRWICLSVAIIIAIGSITLFVVKKTNQYAFIKKGDTIKLGKYEQDNNTENGAEDVEWVVINKEGDALLVASKYCLDNKPYNDTGSYESVDWEHCTLRKWLNDDFYESAFTDDEKKHINRVNLQNPDSPGFNQPGGYNTIDNIFLLSYADIQSNYSDYRFSISRMSWDIEGEKYTIAVLSSDKEENSNLKVQYTEYARETYIKAQCSKWKNRTEEDIRKEYSDIEDEYGNKAASWWLRTPGDNWFSTMMITCPGGALTSPSQSATIGVRPAMIVSAKELEKDKKDSSNSVDKNEDESKEYIDNKSVDGTKLSQIFADEQKLFFTGSNGKVFHAEYSEGDYSDVYTWENVKKVEGGTGIVLGLKTDGKVLVSTSVKTDYDLERIKSHSGIVDICVSDRAYNDQEGKSKGCVALLDQDGTAFVYYADGSKYYIKDIKQICASYNTFAFLRKDGTVDGERYNGQNYSDVLKWKGIKQIACGDSFVAGLKKDGTVIVSGGYLTSELDDVYLLNEKGKAEKSNCKIKVSEWKEVVSISGGTNHLVALKKDGTVLSGGLNSYGQCNTKKMAGVKKIEASNNMTVCYKKDGSVEFIGKFILENIVSLKDKGDCYLAYTR